MKRRIICIALCVALCLCALACANEAPALSAFSTPEPTPTPTPTPEPTPEPTPTPIPLKELKQGDSGEDVTRLNERLIELGYIDELDDKGTYGEDTALAVEMYRLFNGMTAGSDADIATLEKIFDENAKTCAEDFAVLAPTTRMSFEELVADNGVYGYPEGYPKEGTYRIIVDVANQVTMVYSKDENGEYTVPVRFMLSSTGLNNATPIGTFSMNSYRVRFSKFVRDGRFGQYWTQIFKAFYFHTMLYSDLNAATYLEDTFNELGQPASHGCVRLTVPDARWMWYHIAPGTQCEIRHGSKDDKQTAYIRSKLILPEPPEEHLNLVAGQSPYTDDWTIEDVPHEVPFVQGAQ